MVLLGGLALAFYGGFAFLYGRNRGFLEVRKWLRQPGGICALCRSPVLGARPGGRNYSFRVALLPPSKRRDTGLAVATLGYPEPGAVCSLASAAGQNDS